MTAPRNIALRDKSAATEYLARRGIVEELHPTLTEVYLCAQSAHYWNKDLNSTVEEARREFEQLRLRGAIDLDGTINWSRPRTARALLFCLLRMPLPTHLEPRRPAVAKLMKHLWFRTRDLDINPEQQSYLFVEAVAKFLVGKTMTPAMMACVQVLAFKPAGELAQSWHDQWKKRKAPGFDDLVSEAVSVAEDYRPVALRQSREQLAEKWADDFELPLDEARRLLSLTDD